MKTAIPLPLDKLPDFCRRWQIVRLEVFGSVLRDDFGPASDVDFLVTWEKNARIGLSALSGAEAELAALIGRPVDLVSRRAVESSSNWLRRRYMLESAEEVYAA